MIHRFIINVCTNTFNKFNAPLLILKKVLTLNVSLVVYLFSKMVCVTLKLCYKNVQKAQNRDIMASKLYSILLKNHLEKKSY